MKESIFSSLTQEDISDADYVFAQKVFKTFEMRSLWNYHDLFFLTDIFLLTDMLVSFQHMCLTNYGLDPYHFYTANDSEEVGNYSMYIFKPIIISDNLELIKRYKTFVFVLHACNIKH